LRAEKGVKALPNESHNESKATTLHSVCYRTSGHFNEKKFKRTQVNLPGYTVRDRNDKITTKKYRITR